MKMKICKDCECEVTEVNKKGICKPCQTRISNMKHRNKQYIPLKKLKNIDINEYNKVMNRRKDLAKPTDVKIINTSKNSEIKELLNQKELVKKDIEDTFNSKKAVVPKDYTSILPVFEQLKVLLTNYIDKYKIAEDIFNKMEIDYRHAVEKFSTAYRDCLLNDTDKDLLEELKHKKELWETRYSILLDERRDIKNVIIEYDKAGYLFSELSKDTIFMTKFDECYKVLNGLTSYLNVGNYKVETSSLVAKEDFVIGVKQNSNSNIGKDLYQVIVKTSKLNYNEKSEFTRSYYATSEDDAIKQAKKFVSRNSGIGEYFYYIIFDWNTAYAINLSKKQREGL